MTNSNLAVQLFQDYTPALAIVEKPAFLPQTDKQRAIQEAITAPFNGVCPSALREPKLILEQAGRRFEAMRYEANERILQDLDSGATYHLRVIMEQVESQVFTASFINGRIVSTQDYLIMPRFVGRSMRYLENAEQAVAGAYENLQSLVMGRKG